MDELTPRSKSAAYVLSALQLVEVARAARQSALYCAIAFNSARTCIHCSMRRDCFAAWSRANS